MAVIERIHFKNRHGTDDYFSGISFDGLRAEFEDHGNDMGCLITDGGFNTWYIKKQGEDKWVLHGIGFPAIVSKLGWVAFFENGVSRKIEDLSISEEEKCILALKYIYIEPNSNSSNSMYFHSYDGDQL